jgi:hypothetical protein
MHIYAEPEVAVHEWTKSSNFNFGKRLPDLAEIFSCEGMLDVCLGVSFACTAVEATGSNAVQCLTSEDNPMTAAP